jgi:hypothetical protein
MVCDQHFTGVHSNTGTDLALKIIDGLGVHKPDHSITTSVPSPEAIQTSIERECARRIFWLIRLADLKYSIYFGTSLPSKDNEISLRLPIDETSFELAVHSALPGNFCSCIKGTRALADTFCTEYLYLAAPRTQYASETGHLIRVFSIYSKIENISNAIEGKRYR